ncbi:MAG: permease [candidate division Zixibacteria bacterium]|nr:permease [candidate division Zixibacteria bacterium]
MLLTRSHPLRTNDNLVRLLIYSSIILLSLDIVYQTYFGISVQNKEKCLLFSFLPRWLFIFYENVVELLIIVLVGIFVAGLLEKYFLKWRRFVPSNPTTAFLYASLIPVCSCGALPLIKTLENKIPFRTIITFVVAAPLLNPYIITVSLTVLGIQYTVLRIISSFILAVSAGYIADYFKNRTKNEFNVILTGCQTTVCCPRVTKDIYLSTYRIFKGILPYVILAGLLGAGMELFMPKHLFMNLNFQNNLLGTAMVILIGVPVYFCNGADVLFLKPFVTHSQLPMGTAIVFSLTSTSICITSLVMLIKFIGKKMTFIILTGLVLMTFLLSGLIEFVPDF